MFNHNDEQLKGIISLFMEKMRDFGFENEESIILLMNAGDKTNAQKILKAVDFLEPKELGIVRNDISKEDVRKEVEKLLIK
jgi:hypothetical protein